MDFEQATSASKEGCFLVGDDEENLTSLTKYIPGGVHQCADDPYMTLLSLSDGFLDLCGYTREELRQQFHDRYIDMVYPEDRGCFLKTVCEQLKAGPYLELEYRVLRKNGPPIWILDKGRLLEDEKGKKCFYCLLIDITQRKREQEILRLSLERHQLILDQTTDIIFEWNMERDSLHFSGNWRKKFGYDPIDKNISERIPLSKNLHPEDLPVLLGLMQCMSEGVPYAEEEFRLRESKGQYIWCRIRATAQYGENQRPIKVVGVIIDIDSQKRQNDALLEQAQRDALTGLYNKAAIKELTEERLRNSRGNAMQAMMIIDVDYFKEVNDTYGHLKGDSLLSDIAAVLKSQIRRSDLAGRIGGDEFLIYLTEITDGKAVRRKAGALLSALTMLAPKKGAPPISCSIGVAAVPVGEGDYMSLYQCADRALYHQKKNGRGGITVYEGSSDSEAWEPSAVGLEIVSEVSNLMDEQLAQYVFRTLYDSQDIESDLRTLLEILGRAYDVSRAYIFESSEDECFGSMTFEWCNEGVAPQLEQLQNYSYEDDLGRYQDNFDENGMYYCAAIDEVEENLRRVLEPQGIRSMLQCAIREDGRFLGGVGFDECRENRRWSKAKVATFELTAKVIATFVIKLRQKQKIERLLRQTPESR